MNHFLYLVWHWTKHYPSLIIGNNWKEQAQSMSPGYTIYENTGMRSHLLAAFAQLRIRQKVIITSSQRFVRKKQTSIALTWSDIVNLPSGSVQTVLHWLNRQNGDESALWDCKVKWPCQIYLYKSRMLQSTSCPKQGVHASLFYSKLLTVTCKALCFFHLHYVETAFCLQRANSLNWG